jgi:hypothetical protein
MGTVITPIRQWEAGELGHYQETARLTHLQGGAGPHFQAGGAVPSRHNKIQMVQRNRRILVQRNSINTEQHKRIIGARNLKETGHGQTP